jgi:hypothetical protein
MNSSGRIRCGSGGGVGLYPPVDLREVANQLDPRNSAQNCDSGADGKRPPEMARAVHDEPSDRADDNACDIAQTVLHASPFARRAGPASVCANAKILGPQKPKPQPITIMPANIVDQNRDE